eukprot:10274408-Lingulodinium_polyedra.AAC.1
MIHQQWSLRVRRATAMQTTRPMLPLTIHRSGGSAPIRLAEEGHPVHAASHAVGSQESKPPADASQRTLLPSLAAIPANRIATTVRGPPKPRMTTVRQQRQVPRPPVLECRVESKPTIRPTPPPHAGAQRRWGRHAK